MTKPGDYFNQYIEDYTRQMLSKEGLPDTEVLETDNLSEVIEKLVIVHIRCWMLEDACAQAQNDTELADIKRKIDICFKVKRPRLVAAINAMVDQAIVTGKSLREDSVKLYKGYTK